MNCKLCDGPIETLRQPLGTRRLATVCICRNCGLLQSSFDKPKAKLKPSISHQADYGGLRIGKKLRAKPFARLITQNIFGVFSILDIGSSYGDLLRELKKQYERVELVGVESDKNIRAGNPTGTEFIQNRIEGVGLVENYYDLVTMLHTLEHLDKPLEVLQKIHKALKPNGYLVIEVPSTEYALSNCPNIVEEYFLDRHTLHFTYNTLEKILQSVGFSIAMIRLNGEIIQVIAGKNGQIVNLRDTGEYARSRLMVDKYEVSLRQNLTRLKKSVSRYADDIKNSYSAVWGAGRLLSAVVSTGLLDYSDFNHVIDNNLKLKSLKIEKSEEVIDGIEELLICSRSHYDEILQEALGLFPLARMVHWWR